MRYLVAGLILVLAIVMIVAGASGSADQLFASVFGRSGGSAAGTLGGLGAALGNAGRSAAGGLGGLGAAGMGAAGGMVAGSGSSGPSSNGLLGPHTSSLTNPAHPAPAGFMVA